MTKKIKLYKGGIRKTRDGYIEIYSPYHPNKNKHNCVLEHRLIMEKHLGRFLTKKEVIHHIDNNKQNNDIENLELFSSVGKHTQKHHIVRDSKGRFTKNSRGCGKILNEDCPTLSLKCGEWQDGFLHLCPACSGEGK